MFLDSTHPQLSKISPRAVVVWNYDGAPIAMLGGLKQSTWPLDIQFSKDGRKIFGATNEASVVMWDLNDNTQPATHIDSSATELRLLE